MSPMEAMSRCGVSHSASVKPGRPADTLRCRYADCAEAHPEAAEDEQVTCTACRTELGLPV